MSENSADPVEESIVAMSVIKENVLIFRRALTGFAYEMEGQAKEECLAMISVSDAVIQLACAAQQRLLAQRDEEQPAVTH